MTIFIFIVVIIGMYAINLCVGFWTLCQKKGTFYSSRYILVSTFLFTIIFIYIWSFNGLYCTREIINNGLLMVF